MEARYLRYWWERGSKIDPQRTTERYYRVLYDMWRRPVIIEKYGSDHKLITTSKFTRRWNRLTRTETYDARGNMKCYIIYRYGRLGNLIGAEYYSPSGEMLKFIDEF